MSVRDARDKGQDMPDRRCPYADSETASAIEGVWSGCPPLLAITLSENEIVRISVILQTEIDRHASLLSQDQAIGRKRLLVSHKSLTQMRQ
jgi:hypothetical protein